MDNKNLLTEGSIRRKLIFFTLNIFLGNLFQQLYNTADSIIVGNFLGHNALAAVSSSGNLIFLTVGLFAGISMGAGVVISNFVGAKAKDQVSRAVHSTIALGIVSSVILTTIGIVFAAPVLRIMNTPESVLPNSITYFRIYFAGSFGFVMYNTFMGILRAAGDSKHPLYYLIISSVLNVILDVVLIAGLGFGVGAAAFATAVSQLFSAVLAFKRLSKIEADYKIELKNIKLDKVMTKKIIQYGLPSGLQNSVMSLSNVVIQSYINTFGEFAMAGIGAYGKIEGFIFIPITSFGMAITTFVGQNLGAQEYDRIKKGIRFGLLCVTASCLVLGAIMMVFAPQLISLFDTHPEVIAYGTERAHIVSMFFALCGFTHIMAAVLRGTGKPTTALMVFLICWCVIRIVIIAVLGPIANSLSLTHWIYPATWLMSSLAFLVIYKRTDLTRAHI
ncbi:MAG: MATE family efflux transporter [Firmicutes bacterium]|nr:MATE family efflux transporter [Bacillota bacterium]